MIEVNYLSIGFLTIYLLQMFFDAGIEKINIGHLEQVEREVPISFKGFIDRDKLSRILDYAAENGQIALIGGFTADFVLLALIVTGFMPAVEDFLVRQGIAYSAAGVLFFLAPGFIVYLVNLSFDYYHTFRIEEKFDFNRATLKIWAKDHLKAGMLSVSIFAVLLISILWAIRLAPSWWWFWGFLIVSAVQISLALLYPVLIAPLFNKFQPVKDQLLAEEIKRLMKKNGIEVKKILEMDAGKRSRHTNAYFTGFGKTKQIVLYDTLIHSHPREEILAVLAHEVGHYKKKHVIKQLVLFEIFMLAGFYLTYRLLEWPLLYSTFGFESTRAYIGLFFIGVFWQKVSYFLKPIQMALSRHFERQADVFAVRLLKNAEPLVTAFKRTASDNLTNLEPHPLYVRFNYSHPPLVERVAYLERIS